ncbi:hypothetical protein [Desulfobotulus sp.]|uniref:hypothetical protein n=1 Tax=Desulfobotulus sp. TaxID=1940337 RepID=UPI002A35D4BF|nr:hypothetical protein [Desulfobotulus sp.]MDY0164313.1 hypothetical protein [Desulfobotulus sp.]
MSAHPRCTMFDVILGTPEYLIQRAMNIRADHLTYIQAREVFGHEAQIAKAAEELSEAAAAILRWRWSKGQSSESRDQMAAELADAEIMLEQMRMLIPAHEIDFQRAEKLTRLRERLNEQAGK